MKGKDRQKAERLSESINRAVVFGVEHPWLVLHVVLPWIRIRTLWRVIWLLVKMLFNKEAYRHLKDDEEIERNQSDEASPTLC